MQVVILNKYINQMGQQITVKQIGNIVYHFIDETTLHREDGCAIQHVPSKPLNTTWYLYGSLLDQKSFPIFLKHKDVLKTLMLIQKKLDQSLYLHFKAQIVLTKQDYNEGRINDQQFKDRMDDLRKQLMVIYLER